MMFIQKTNKNKRLKYIKEHKNVWPECLKAHKESGIEREIIWMDRVIVLYAAFLQHSYISNIFSSGEP